MPLLGKANSIEILKDQLILPPQTLMLILGGRLFEINGTCDQSK